MKQLRKRLTYANVMSSIAVFLVLGGGAAIAADQLAKNSVGKKQLKAGAVTAGKIKRNAVTKAKIRNGAVTGAKVNEATLGTVPSAAHSINSDSAVNAGNANTVGGHSVNKVFAKIPRNSSTTLGTFGVFKITAECDATGDVTLVADPQTEDTDYTVFGNGSSSSYFAREQGAEDNSEVISGGNDRGTLTFAGSQSGGAVVTGTLGWDDSEAFDLEDLCAVYGYFIV